MKMNTTQQVRRLHPTVNLFLIYQASLRWRSVAGACCPQITCRMRVLLEPTQVSFVLQERLQPSGVGRNAP